MDRLIARCAQAGIAEWVCCPGALNAPLLTALARCPVIHRWHVQDERAAGYFALGRMQATGRGVAVAAGSGSDAVGILPAVMEAFYERRPLVVVTMDDLEPAEGAGAYGRVEQDGLFGLYAPTITLHMPCSVADLPDMIDLCRDGFPVHLRLCCVEDLPGMPPERVPEVADAPLRPAFSGSLVDLARVLRYEAPHEGLALMLGALDPDEQEAALWLARTLRAPVVADATSGLREKIGSLLLTGGSDILTDDPPRYVLRVGAVPSCPFWRALEEMPGTQVYSVTRAGFAGLKRATTVIEGEPEQVVKALDDVPHVGDPADYLSRGRRYAGRVEELLLTYPESDAALIRAFSQYACLAETLCLGSPSAMQLWNEYAQRQTPALYLRSASLSGGNDGALAAFLGNSVDAAFSCALIGDISLMRDTAASQFLPQVAPGKRVIAVLNNEGAGQARYADAELRALMAQPLSVGLREMAVMLGAEYYPIRAEADFDVMDGLDDEAFALLEICPDAEQSEALRRGLP